MTIKNIVKKITPILQEQGVIKVALFGSVVRGEAGKKVMLIFWFSLKMARACLI